MQEEREIDILLRVLIDNPWIDTATRDAVRAARREILDAREKASETPVNTAVYKKSFTGA